MASDVDICNLALVHVGQSQFLDGLDDDTTAARILRQCFGPLRDKCLESVWWPFATKHATLALLSGVTRSGWAGAYSLPADCLAPQYLYAGARRGAPLVSLSPVASGLSAAMPLPLAGVGQPIPFALEANDALDGRLLLTDATTPELVYTAKLTTSGLFSPGFVDALAYLLAERLARGLFKRFDLADKLGTHFKQAIAEAWGAVFRGQQPDTQPDSEFISVRG